MTAVEESPVPTILRRGVIAMVAVGIIIAHGFGCHGDGVDTEPGLHSHNEPDENRALHNE